jgi:hypothetical protein
MLILPVGWFVICTVSVEVAFIWFKAQTLFGSRYISCHGESGLFCKKKMPRLLAYDGQFSGDLIVCKKCRVKTTDFNYLFLFYKFHKYVISIYKNYLHKLYAQHKTI